MTAFTISNSFTRRTRTPVFLSQSFLFCTKTPPAGRAMRRNRAQYNIIIWGKNIEKRPLETGGRFLSDHDMGGDRSGTLLKLKGSCRFLE